jgi:hypothetical protein
MISDDAKLKAIKAVKNFGKPVTLGPGINKVEGINMDKAKEIATHGKTTTFKRTRTSKTGKKITETVTRKSKGRSKVQAKGVRTLNRQGAFPLTFAEYYKWLNGDAGWEAIDEKLGNHYENAIDGHSTWSKDKSPQNAIKAYKAAVSASNKEKKKRDSREVIDLEPFKKLKPDNFVPNPKKSEGKQEAVRAIMKKANGKTHKTRYYTKEAAKGAVASKKEKGMKFVRFEKRK